MIIFTPILNSESRMSSSTTETDSDEPERLISELVTTAETAMERIADYDQSAVDDLVRSVAWGVYEEERCREISEVAVGETGLGDVGDKYQKKRRKIAGALDGMLGAETVGVVDVDEERNLVEIAKPVGVVGAVVPSTNPGATPILLTMMALKGRNAIILSPSPRGQSVCELVVDAVHERLESFGAPTDLVQMVPPPVSKEKTYELMDRVDLLQVTGSANNVQAGQESGTPNYCVGKGNPVAFVDETADIEAAADRIVASKTFDNSTSCSSEGNAVIVSEVHEGMLAALERRGGYMLDDEQRGRIRELLFPDGAGSLNREALAVTPAKLCEMAGINDADAREADLLLTEGRGVGPQYPLSGEKITPVLNVFEVSDFQAGLDLTTDILDYEGAGHSVGLHTRSEGRAVRAGEEIEVARLLVNQVHCYSNGGHYQNGLGSTLSEGGGTWGGNQLDENVTYEQFYQTTTVTRPIEDATPPDPDSLFAEFMEES